MKWYKISYLHKIAFTDVYAPTEKEAIELFKVTTDGYFHIIEVEKVEDKGGGENDDI